MAEEPLRKKSRKKPAFFDQDVELSKRGEKQIGFELTTRAADFPKVDEVYVSPQKRALLTAMAAYKGKKLIVDSRLAEIGGCYMRSAEELSSYMDVKAGSTNCSKQSVFKINKEGSEPFLVELARTLVSGKKAAVFGHKLNLREMVADFGAGFHGGNKRIWPLNFRPYLAKVKDGCFIPATAEDYDVVVCRHAESAAQAERRGSC